MGPQQGGGLTSEINGAPTKKFFRSDVFVAFRWSWGVLFLTQGPNCLLGLTLAPSMLDTGWRSPTVFFFFSSWGLPCLSGHEPTYGMCARARTDFCNSRSPLQLALKGQA